MGIERSVKRTGFYEELTEEKRLEYLDLKRSKYLPTIDNLYYSVYVAGDSRDNKRIMPLIERLEELKAEVVLFHQPVAFERGLVITTVAVRMYRICASDPDLYDILFCPNMPNDETPRIQIQLRAMGLWTRGVDEILAQSYQKAAEVLADYGCEIERVMETRIDYCYHTNAIAGPGKAFREVKGRIPYMDTNLQRGGCSYEIERYDGGAYIRKDFITLGERKANNLYIRIYDKVKEVIEMGYKGFFFKIWHDSGLISYYDNWCMEYAMPHRNVLYLNKARLAFYAEYGTDEKRRKEYAAALANPDKSMADYKTLADAFMPQITAVTNIEYETKRKFYVNCDDFIEGFKHLDHETSVSPTVPKPLKRLYKILDNKSVFLNYFTSKSLSFHTATGADGEWRYLDWWERLRNTKLGGVENDAKLLRDYSHAMDKKCIQARAINAIASAAVYGDNVETGFVEDMSDFLADISDNQKHKAGLAFVTEDGKAVEVVYGERLRHYLTVKARKEMQLKNRKKRQAAEVDAANSDETAAEADAVNSDGSAASGDGNAAEAVCE
jgi:hypothetical protein